MYGWLHVYMTGGMGFYGFFPSFFWQTSNYATLIIKYPTYLLAPSQVLMRERIAVKTDETFHAEISLENSYYPEHSQWDEDLIQLY